MTYKGLCELVQARGWTIVLAAENGGSKMLTSDAPGILYRLAIYESRQARAERHPPLIAVRLDQPPTTLDEAAAAIGVTLHSAGVF